MPVTTLAQISAAARDADLIDRLTSAAAAQGIDAPQQWAETHAREIVATPVDSDGNTLGSLHAYAVASYTPAPRPGEDATKIADAAIKAAVAAVAAG